MGYALCCLLHAVRPVNACFFVHMNFRVSSSPSKINIEKAKTVKIVGPRKLHPILEWHLDTVSVTTMGPRTAWPEKIGVSQV